MPDVYPRPTPAYFNAEISEILAHTPPPFEETEQVRFSGFRLDDVDQMWSGVLSLNNHHTSYHVMVRISQTMVESTRDLHFVVFNTLAMRWDDLIEYYCEHSQTL